MTIMSSDRHKKVKGQGHRGRGILWRPPAQLVLEATALYMYIEMWSVRKHIVVVDQSFSHWATSQWRSLAVVVDDSVRTKDVTKYALPVRPISPVRPWEMSTVAVEWCQKISAIACTVPRQSNQCFNVRGPLCILGRLGRLIRPAGVHNVVTRPQLS